MAPKEDENECPNCGREVFEAESRLAGTKLDPNQELGLGLSTLICIFRCHFTPARTAGTKLDPQDQAYRTQDLELFVLNAPFSKAHTFVKILKAHIQSSLSTCLSF